MGLLLIPGSVALVFMWLLDMYPEHLTLVIPVCNVVVCVILLSALSIPRRIKFTPDQLLICCVLEITVINRRDIESVEHLEKLPDSLFPVISIYGFGGYYGYWFNFRTGTFCKMYATRRRACLCLHRSRKMDIIINADLTQEASEVEKCDHCPE